MSEKGEQQRVPGLDCLTRGHKWEQRGTAHSCTHCGTGVDFGPNNPTPQPAGEVRAPEPCAVCSFHWNQIVMPGEAHNRNCPHYDDRDNGCRCQRCGTRYKVDVMVSDELWAMIHRYDTLLCGNCIISAIEKLGKFDYYNLAQGD